VNLLMKIAARSLGLLGAGVVLAFSTIFVGCQQSKPQLPPLLEHVSANGGQWGACPSESAGGARLPEGRPLALSPELNQRLAQVFPVGSSEERLVETLRQQGFKLLPPCNTDTYIRAADFTQHGGGGLSYLLTASVFWKVDESGNLVWTKGFVRYTGL
jgi:hypothetical protein